MILRTNILIEFVYKMPRRGRRGKRSSKSIPKATKKSVTTGIAPRINPDPSSIVSIPWNSVTITLRNESTSAFTSADFVKIIRSQLSLTDAQEFEFRTREYSIYAIEQAIELKVLFFSWETSEDANDFYTQLADYPGENHRAAVKFILPWTAQSVTLRASLQTDVKFYKLYQANQKTYNKIRILWKTCAKASADPRHLMCLRYWSSNRVECDCYRNKVLHSGLARLSISSSDPSLLEDCGLTLDAERHSSNGADAIPVCSAHGSKSSERHALDSLPVDIGDVTVMRDSDAFLNDIV